MKKGSADVDALIARSRWAAEMNKLRALALEAGLVEEQKWGKACYALDGKNVAIVQCFKEYVAFAFFDGVSLKDPAKILVAPGAHSQTLRQARFDDAAAITQQEAVLKRYLKEAIANAKAAPTKKEKRAPVVLVLPDELLAKLDAAPKLKAAFFALTPGRQRAYVIHISQAKQSATRAARVDKCAPMILRGKGLNDR